MDAESVVAELKLTPKGRLVYGKDWDRNEDDISFILNNSDSGLIEQYIKLSPSPTKDIYLGRKHGEKEFKNKGNLVCSFPHYVGRLYCACIVDFIHIFLAERRKSMSWSSLLEISSVLCVTMWPVNLTSTHQIYKI